MTGPARNLVDLIRSAGPLTLGELAERTQYRPDRVLAFIVEARANGYPIRCVMQPGEPSTFVLQEEE